MAKMPKPEEMIASRASFPDKSWMDVKTEIKPGMYAYPAKVEIMEGSTCLTRMRGSLRMRIGTCRKLGRNHL